MDAFSHAGALNQMESSAKPKKPIQKNARKMMTARSSLHIGLLSGLAFMLSACVGVTNQEPETSTVKSGRRTELGTISAITPGCRDVTGIYPDTVDYPKHGQVSFEWKDVLVGLIKEGPRRACSGRRGAIAFVYYRPDPGFTGDDHLTVRLGSKITRINIKVVK
ncbi:hypothetical protein [Rhizobium rhizogenes]|uniref:hypothetical protein n=1 Tax=Rhizobium rhizogenes TaxID=359 RepID=UPI001F26C5A2|nr:hypothetical protein [Rhizobium rhizogenes]MDJ1636675.1 hypothetical protein [Rhizobium rhizogenes]